MSQQIVVIGAGIAGLATAVALQRQRLDVRVVEARTDTASGAGISIWPNALAALDQIGVGDTVRQAGGRITAGALRWRDRPRRQYCPDRLLGCHRRHSPCGDRRGRDALRGGPPPQRATARPLHRLYRVARSRRVHHGPRSGRRDAWTRFAAFRRARVGRVVREAALIGKVINLRPAFLSAVASHASVLIPEPLLTRQLASVAAGAAFVLPRLG
jgi:glycine/D-amino acid oxidase-like deaminating enzyme